MKLENKTYDILKYVGLIAIPAFAVFLNVVFETWHIPYGPQIITTINAFGVLLGALLKKSTDNYNKAKEGEAK